MISPKDIEVPEGTKRKTKYYHIESATPGKERGHGGRDGTRYRAIYEPRRGQIRNRGSVFRTQLEAAQDYCDYINRKNGQPQVHVKTSSGRPDYYKDATGQLHMDLPPTATTRKPTETRTSRSDERDLMLRMQSKVNALLGPNDFAEAKASIDRQPIATAVGQLLRKHFEAGKGRMFIVLPSTPDKATQDFLCHHNITLIAEL